MFKRPNTLEDWINYLANEEFPVLSNTMSRLGNLDDFVVDFPSEMASIILQDPNMTVRVLKMANSAYYNIGLKKINSVSRAVMFLGYDTVRAICLSTGVFQQLLKKDPSERLLRGITGSFQAAVLTQQVADVCDNPDSEEMFISSLLFHIGEMAFWTFGGDAATEINELMFEQGMTQIEAQEEVLGFRLSDLTYGLAEHWGMSKVLLSALHREDSPESNSRNVVLSHRLLNVSSLGWASPQTQRVVHEIAKYADISIKDTHQLIVDSAEETVEVLRGHGFTHLIGGINFPPGTNIDVTNLKPKKISIARNKAKNVLKGPDKEIINNILDDLQTLGDEEDELDINFVLQLVLEGIHRGVGMDCSLVALMDNRDGKLKGKNIIQDKNTNLVADFNFTLSTTPLFQLVINKRKILWSLKAVQGAMSGELLAKFRVMLGTNDFLVGPLMIQGRPIGLYYADRQFTNQKLTLDDLDAFRTVINRANDILTSFGR